jgi:hypothetical protein
VAADWEAEVVSARDQHWRDRAELEEARLGKARPRRG